MTATAMKTRKTNGVHLRNRQIHGEYKIIPSSENTFLAVMVVAVIVEAQPAARHWTAGTRKGKS